jgi:multidrug resistance efflux pump
MTNGPDIMKNINSRLPTLLLVLVAVVIAFIVYQRWVHNPWTRHGQVRAEIVKVAPRVSGYIVEIAVRSNQFVRKGDLLFRIDPSSYQLAADGAQVRLRQAREGVAALEATVQAAAARVLQSEAGVVAARAMIKQQEAALANARSESGRATRLLGDKAGSVENAERKAAMVLELQAAVDSARAAFSEAEAAVASAQAGLDQARANLGEPGDANVRIREAKVQLEDAELYLGWTSMYAPFDGYITNLEVNEGQFAAPGHPIAAFVDSRSFRVDGYFQESKLRHIKPGDRAVMTLMSHPDIELTGIVDSIGYAINPPHTASTEGALFLVPQIQPTFDWIRLPQRVPVRIHLEDVPEDIQLVSGMTTSVAIRPSRGD